MSLEDISFNKRHCIGAFPRLRIATQLFCSLEKCDRAEVSKILDCLVRWKIGLYEYAACFRPLNTRTLTQSQFASCTSG